MFESQEQLQERIAAVAPSALLAQARDAIRARRHEVAIALLDRRLSLAPEEVEALCLSALARWRAHIDVASAGPLLAQARRLAPEDARVFALSAEFCLRFGDSEGVRRFAKAALALDPDRMGALITLARSEAEAIDDKSLQAMRRKAEERANLSAARRRNLWNAIGRVHDARGEHDAAFAAYLASNRLAPGRYDKAARMRRLAEARLLFTPEFVRKRREVCADGGEDCVFILGMPRSGSTLIESVLLGHPDVGSAGEADALPAIDAALIRQAGGGSYFAHLAYLDLPSAQSAAKAYRKAIWRSLTPAGARVAIDKRLGNFLSLPLIRLLAPQATLIHAWRHPLDLCFACFVQDFEGHDYANDLGDLAHYHQLYQEYMTLWDERLGARLIHCAYEDFSADPGAQARRIVAAAGLDWREGCAAPHLRQGFVNTASAAQLREPVHQRRVGRWRAYERHLGPLIDGLGGWKRIEAAAKRFR